MINLAEPDLLTWLLIICIPISLISGYCLYVLALLDSFKFKEKDNIDIG